MSLTDDIVDLLKAEGPMETEFIRTRLCVASKARFEAAVYMAMEHRRIETFRAGKGGAGAYRIPGDTREILPGDIWSVWERRRRKVAA